MASCPALDLRYTPRPDTAALLDLLYAALDDFEPLAIQDIESADGLRVFFRSAAQRDAAVTALRRDFAAQPLAIEALDVPDEGWAQRSQAALTAVRVGRLVVAPPWAVPASDSLVIVIEPSTGFGTGHHPTTRLCLELLQRVDPDRRRVIDVGTGSGVLAIASWKLGAAAVLAIDHDPDALENARENIGRNGGAEAIEVREADLSTIEAQPADIVLANLTAGAIETRHRTLGRLVAPGGDLILSGFNRDDVPTIVGLFRSWSPEVATEGEWAAVLLRR